MSDYLKAEKPIEIYIISAAGLCFSNVKNKDSKYTTKANQDLIAPFLSGFDNVVKEAFDADLEEMILVNGNSKIRISIKRFSINKIDFKVVALVKKNTSNIDIQDKLMKIYFAIKDNNWYKHLNSSRIPCEINNVIESKLERILFY